ncbi:MAG: hypothetical protein H7Y32_18650, partial [Chloroflexales bacterium]|nr:hypothetical protein [Chloroflexales bacterium]
MLQVHLLGHLRVLMNDEPWPFHSRPKALPLWAYLLLHHDHPLSRDQIAFALWPDTSEGEARANLRRHLHHLQNALPAAPQPWLLATARTIQWNPNAAYWLDVAAFEQLCHDEAAPGAAVALYTGDLLERLDEEWLLPERERLRVLYQASLLRHTRACQATRAYGAAITSAQRMVRHDPLHEDAQRLLMTLHYESGDRAGGLAA